jgi:heme exporter protein C
MRKQWWKILSALLVLSTLTAGFLTPLAPGIASVSPDAIKPGTTQIKVTGYNTHFAKARETLQIWLVNSGAIYCPFETVVVSDTELRATFSIDAELGDSFFDLYINSAPDGTLVLPSALMQSGMKVGFASASQEPCLGTLAPANTGKYQFPNQSILNETIRNLLFHVPAWFAMLLLMLLSLVHSIRYLRGGQWVHDRSAANAAHVGLVFAAAGLVTGSIWARFTWGAWWVSDPRLNGAAIGVLIYLAYFVLRGSINDHDKAARLSAVYNVFAFFMMILFVMVLPRLTDSLHPGVGGNPAFSQYDLDDNMRLAFYPAVLGWMGIGCWMLQLRNRMDAFAMRAINKPFEPTKP